MDNKILGKGLKILIIINFLCAIRIPIIDYFISHINFICCVLSGITFLLFFYFKQDLKITKFFGYLLIYYGVLFLSTFLSPYPLKPLIAEIGSIILMILIWSNLDKKEFYSSLDTIVLLLEILTYINFILAIFFPNGLYHLDYTRNYYLFDHVNVTIRYLLPGCCLTMIRSYLKEQKLDKRSYCYVGVVALTLLLTWPVTSILGFGLFIILLIIMKRLPKKRDLFYPFNSYLFFAVASFLVIKVKIQNLIAPLIVTILHRDITFTGRTVIWRKVLSLIGDRPFLGYGRLSQEARTAILGSTSPHNQFLIFLFEGGILLLIVVTYIIYDITKQLKKCTNLPITNILLAVMATYFLMWMTEPFSYSGTALMFFIWLLCYRSPELFNKKTKI